MAEKVTIQFSSIADQGQGEDIIVSGAPIELFTSVNSINDLQSIQGLPTDRDIIVYVRNVINSTTRQQSAFYKHDHDTNEWREVLLGSHSHENKEILDQIGNIDASNLPYDENKILTLKKVDNDGSEDEDVSWKYKLEWVDQPKDLPPIPDELKNSPVYLTAEDGKYVWKEKIIPTQTFKYRQLEITETSKSCVIDNVQYNPDDGDQILLFDDGQFLYDYKTSYENNSLKITLIDSHEFTAGEKLTLLIIKNGISGFLNTLASEYVTKEEAIDILSGKGISLRKYATKADLDKKADKQHTHTQFSRVGHTHDERYAMYSHSHDGVYVRESEVYSIISGLLSNLVEPGYDITEDDINKIFETAINKLYSETKALIDKKADLVYVEEEIKKIRDDFNTDSIIVSIPGYKDNTPLTNYLLELEEKVRNASSTSSDVVFDTPIRVNLGEGNSLGGYNDGDIIELNTSLQQFTKKLLTKQVLPELIEPTISLKITVNHDDEHKDNFYEPGDKNVSFRVTPEINKNDAGMKLSAILTITTYEEDKEISKEEYDMFSEEYIDVELNVYDGIFAKFDLKVKFDQGKQKLDNIGNKYFVKAKELQTTEYLSGNRKCFIGEYSPSSGYRSAPMSEIPTESFMLECKSYNKAHDIIIAFPAENKIHFNNAYYLNQGTIVDDLFNYKLDKIAGANGYKPIYYDIRTLHVDAEINDVLYFKIFIGEDDLNGKYFFK